MKMTQHVRTSLWLTAAATLVGAGMLMTDDQSKHVFAATLDAQHRVVETGDLKPGDRLDKEMTNTYLQEIVLQALNRENQSRKKWQEFSEVKVRDVAHIKRLAISTENTIYGTNIPTGEFTLNGLKYFTDLEELSLDGSIRNFDDKNHFSAGQKPVCQGQGKITRLKQLERLHKLKSVDLSNNMIRDISSLAGLPELSVLRLE